MPAEKLPISAPKNQHQGTPLPGGTASTKGHHQGHKSQAFIYLFYILCIYIYLFIFTAPHRAVGTGGSFQVRSQPDEGPTVTAFWLCALKGSCSFKRLFLRYWTQVFNPHQSLERGGGSFPCSLCLLAQPAGSIRCFLPPPAPAEYTRAFSPRFTFTLQPHQTARRGYRKVLGCCLTSPPRNRAGGMKGRLGRRTTIGSYSQGAHEFGRTKQSTFFSPPTL